MLLAEVSQFTSHIAVDQVLEIWEQIQSEENAVEQALVVRVLRNTVDLISSELAVSLARK